MSLNEEGMNKHVAAIADAVDKDSYKRGYADAYAELQRAQGPDLFDAIIEWSAATKEYSEAPEPPTFSDARLTKAENELHRLALLSAPTPQHGIDCLKVPHTRDGYLHDEADDGPYDVDGVMYCGRCHLWLSAPTPAEPIKEKS
jgi:hypothetical protein